MIDIVKGNVDGKRVYRTVASFDRLADRVILNCVTAYVRDVLEGVLGENCYSFRKDSKMNHQSAVMKLQEWRRNHAHGKMFVAECDIKKFFDNISHSVVRKCWSKIGFDAEAKSVLEAYLSVYSSSSQERRGLPQGGSFSTVLANMVMCAADDAIGRMGDGNLFYARFCDDVIFAHSAEAACSEAMARYQKELIDLDLPIHPVEDFTYKSAGGKSTDYYGIKSKGPFLWAEPKVGERNVAPWVSFLGSQIRFDGETRIRKESINKHLCAMGRETAMAFREIERNQVPAEGAHAWFSRFRNRLITKGVGYVTAKVKDCDMSWAGSFPNVTPCADTKMQMRRLDRFRERMLSTIWKLLPKGVRLGLHRYKGRPFSYYAFLEKAVRPTNMAPRRRNSFISYSEL